ncbi:MAG: hypothetical protein ACI4TW_00860 [Prevotella sp.]
MRKIYLKKVLFAACIIMAATPATADDIAGSGDQPVVFYESFDKLDGLGGNDGYFDNDDDAGVEIAATDLTDASLLDNTEGWGDFTKVAVCNKCVRLATKKNNGEITTPEISLDGSDATLTFNAAAQLADAVTVYVEAIGGGTLTYNGVSDSKIGITLPLSATGETVLSASSYSVGITGVSASVRLKFSSISSSTDKQRFFLDEIKVTKALTNGIANTESRTGKPERIYSIDGRLLPDTSVSRLPKGVYVVNGRKTVVK